MLGIEEGAKPRTAPCIHLLGCPDDQPEHYMGLDGNARDVFSRVVYGARVSLWIGLVTVGFAIIIGTFIGADGRLLRAATDNVLMRLMDVVLAFPSLLLAIAIVTVLGQSLINAQLAIGIVAIPVYARVMRSSVLSVREQDFVAASQRPRRIAAGILCPPDPAELADAAHRPGHARHRRGDPRGRRPLVPRPGRPAAPRRVGLDDRHRAQRGLRGAPPVLFPGLAIVMTVPRLQPPGRRPPRRPRPEAEPMTADRPQRPLADGGRHRGAVAGRDASRAARPRRAPLLEVEGPPDLVLHPRRRRPGGRRHRLPRRPRRDPRASSASRAAARA